MFCFTYTQYSVRSGCALRRQWSCLIPLQTNERRATSIHALQRKTREEENASFSQLKCGEIQRSIDRLLHDRRARGGKYRNVAWTPNRSEGARCGEDGSPARLQTSSALREGETEIRGTEEEGGGEMFKVRPCRLQVRPRKAPSRTSCRKWAGTERRMHVVWDICVILQISIICTSSGKAPRRNYGAPKH